MHLGWIYVFVVSALVLASHFLPEGGGLELKYTLSDPGQSTIDYMLSVSELIVSLNSAVFVVAGALAFKGDAWTLSWKRLDSVIVVGALILGATSYYAVYVQHMSALGLIYAGTISPFQSDIFLAMQVQYYATLGALFLVGLVFVRLLNDK